MLKPKAVARAASGQTVQPLEHHDVEVVLLTLPVQQSAQIFPLTRQRSGHAVEDDLIYERHPHPLPVVLQQRELRLRRRRAVRRIAGADETDIAHALKFLPVHAARRAFGDARRRRWSAVAARKPATSRKPSGFASPPPFCSTRSWRLLWSPHENFFARGALRARGALARGPKMLIDGGFRQRLDRGGAGAIL